MQVHIKQCVFQNVKCPSWLFCKAYEMPMGNVVDHLKETNQAIELKGNGPEVIATWPIEQMGRNRYYRPLLKHFDGCSFLINCHKKEYTLIFWLTIVGTEEDAQKYEVKLRAESTNADTCIRTRGKVYSIGIRKTDVLKCTSGFLEISE